MPQGTIRSFDATTRSGSLLDDGLNELRFSGRAMQASGLRELRIGQRVRYTLVPGEDAAEVATLNIVSL